VTAAGAGVIALVRGAAAWRLVAGVRLGDAGHETHFVHPQTLTTALIALWEVQPEPDLIVTHLTGTALGDAYELAGLDAGPWRHVPRLVLKPLIGHTLGASGAVELALALNSPARRMWKLSLGFGGHLAAVAVAR
jgi:3-oxoacyl-[acyl-carrier-protein] synthase-1